MARTITTLQSTGVVFDTTQDPLTITDTGAVVVASGNAIDGPGGQAWSVANAGSVSGSSGIVLAAGGSVSNAASGTIRGPGGAGIAISNASGTVVNDGVVSGRNRAIDFQGASGTVSNSGSLTATDTSSGYGVMLGGGGTITNTASGFIGARTAIGAIVDAATIDNAGRIVASYAGIVLNSGGSITNAAGGTIAGTDYLSIGVYISGAPGTVVNSGLIYGGNGVYLNAGGSVQNTTTGTIGSTASWIGVQINGGGSVTNAGTIVSNWNGVVFDSAAGTLDNSGTIIGYVKNVSLASGGVVTNAASGLITTTDTDAGAWAVVAAGGTATIGNAGTIYGNADGIVLLAGGSVVNTGTITGMSNVGVYISGGGTVSNSGTIIGGASGAVQFVGPQDDRMILSAGAAFQGVVTGGSGTNTLELAGPAAGSLSGLGTQFIGFSQIVVDSGASWTMTGTNTLAAGTTITNAGSLTFRDTSFGSIAALINNGAILIDPSSVTVQDLGGAGSVTIAAASTLTVNGSISAGETIIFADGINTLQLGDTADDAGVIASFASGDTITLTGITDAIGASVVNGNTVQVTRSGHAAIDLTFDPAGDLSAATFHVVEQAGNAILTADNLACFAQGTRIATADGPRLVEDLRAGERVRTASGALRPIRWIGFRHIDLTRHRTPRRAAPVRIAAGAFADGVPSRDLRLSPEHAVLLDGTLVPIRLLVNGASIRWEDQCRSVTYFHVELDAHDILLAEGLACESYLDTGNRGIFENAGLPLVLHPDLSHDQARREAESCAPFAADPAHTEPLWHRLAQRADRIGLALPAPPATHRDPMLRVLVGTRALAPVSDHDGVLVFMLPPHAGTVRLVSRSAVPADLRPWLEDRRRLGVMVGRLTLRRSHEVETIPLDHPSLVDGWWAVERHGQAMRRWTTGDAALPVAGDGPAILEISVAGALDYTVEETTATTEAGSRVA